MNSYSAKYTDRNSCEAITFNYDGEILQTTIRGVEFRGSEFDDLEPSNNTPVDLLKQFTFSDNALCSCCLECEIPIDVCSQDKIFPGILSIAVILGNPKTNGSIDCEQVQITLTYNSNKFKSYGVSGWFEEELLEIQAQLPKHTLMRICFNCLYSDYSPLGHGLFGCMMCFRNIKSEYLTVKSKADFWSIHNRYDRFVGETYCCSEFEPRISGTGYRR